MALFERVGRCPGQKRRVGGKAYHKVKVGEQAARHPYLPFCTLRCGLAYARHHYAKGRKKK